MRFLTAAMGMISWAILVTAPQPSRSAEAILLQALSSDQRTVLLTPASNQALVTEVFQGRLVPGENEVLCWAPHLPVPAEALRLAVPEGLQILEWEEDQRLPARRWTVQAPQEGDYRLGISYQLPQLTYRFSYRFDWAGESGDLQVCLHLTNALPQPLRVQTVLYQPPREKIGPRGAAPEAAEPRLELRGPLALPPHIQHRQVIAQLTEVTGETVYEYDGKKVTERLELAPTPEQLAQLACLPSGELTVAFPFLADHLPVSAGNLSQPSGGKLVLHLGPTEDIVVTRIMVHQQKTAVEFDGFHQVSGFDWVETYQLEATNYLSEPVRLRIWEQVMPVWELVTEEPVREKQGNRVAFELKLGPGETSRVNFTLVKHSGSRAEEN